MPSTVSQILLSIFFLTIVYLHVVKKNFDAAAMYSVQSFVIVLLWLNAYLETREMSLLLVAILVCIVKVILAPAFFIRLMQRHQVKFSASTYLNTPLTLISISLLTAVAYSSVLRPLTSIVPAHQTLLSIALASMFIALFLTINRKGALSQIIGILSLENSIVAFALFAGLEQSFALQVGVLFTVSVWIIIATIFISMLYRHFGSFDVTEMNQLQD